MVHRLHNRNTGYSDNFTSMLANNQAAINATKGATALNLNNEIEVEEKPNSNSTIKEH